MIRPLINLLKAEGIHNAKLLAAMPLIFSSFIFFQNQILIVYFSSVITSYVIHIIFELLTGNKDFYKQIDLTFLYLALIFPMTIVSNITIAGVITGSFIFSAAYVLLKKSGVRIFNPIILGWGYIFFIYRHYYQLPLPSEIVKTYSEFSPDLITAATPSALYFINGNSVSWERIFLGLSIGAPCELFLTAILIGLFLQIGAKAISYRILVSAVAAYMIPSAIYFFIKSGFVFNRVLFTNIVNFLILGPFLFLITFVLDDGFSVPQNKKMKIIYGLTFGFAAAILKIIFNFKSMSGYVLLIIPLVFYLIEMKMRKPKELEPVLLTQNTKQDFIEKG